MPGRRKHEARPGGGDDDLAIIELIDADHDDGGGDVAFGLRSSRSERTPSTSGVVSEPGRRRGPIIAGVVGAVALFGGALVFGRSDTTPSVTARTTGPDSTDTGPTSAVETAATEPNLTVTTAPAIGDSVPVEAAVPTSVDLGTGPIVTGDVAESAYLAYGSDFSRLSRLDLATGVLTAVANDNGLVRAVLPTVAGPVFVTSISTPGQFRWAPGPGAGMWTPDGDGNLLNLVDPTTGGNLETLDVKAGDLGVLLVGSTAEGRPVVLGPDLRAYSVGVDGTFSRIGTGLVKSVQAGGFWETVCDDNRGCQNALNGTGTILVPDPGADGSAVAQPSSFAAAFSGNGRFVMVTDVDGASVVDFADGSITELTANSGRIQLDVLDQYLTGLFTWQPPVAWAGPDDRYLLVAHNGDLVIYDTADRSSRLLSLPLGITTVAVVGVA